jgi:tRNA-splicing endonuclease subunit Sen2|mmetsp:Transcript_3176/g.11469  ORF Transcript_3176/g.11469 Transcript_3176/m.11469 type:complete len:279 (+) Transcript_3176:348-1184(+)
MARDGIKWKKGKRRVAHQHKRPEQLLRELCGFHLKGTYSCGQVWIGTTRRQAYLLEQVCLGRRAKEFMYEGVPLTPNGPGIELVIRVNCEDAYYMCVYLGCLSIYRHEAGKEMDVKLGLEESVMDVHTLWATFRCECGHAFALKCAATVHFRLTGWLPRSGLQYGADFVLYQRHPALVHSDATVVLVPDEGARRSFVVDTEKHRGVAIAEGWPDWPDLQATSRLAVQVNKNFIEAHVSAPRNVNWNDPACLTHVWVNEISIARFNPTRHLDNTSKDVN